MYLGEMERLLESHLKSKTKLTRFFTQKVLFISFNFTPEWDDFRLLTLFWEPVLFKFFMILAAHLLLMNISNIYSADASFFGFFHEIKKG